MRLYQSSNIAIRTLCSCVKALKLIDVELLWDFPRSLYGDDAIQAGTVKTASWKFFNNALLWKLKNLEFWASILNFKCLVVLKTLERRFNETLCGRSCSTKRQERMEMRSENQLDGACELCLHQELQKFKQKVLFPSFRCKLALKAQSFFTIHKQSRFNPPVPLIN